MDWITTEVAIGNYIEARDEQLQLQCRFNSVLCLDGKSATQGNPDRERVVVKLEDGPGNDVRTFLHAVNELLRLSQSHAPVFVHCHAGRSRSVVVVAAYLMKTRGLDAQEAFAQVADKREVAVTPGLLQLLESVDP